MAGLSAAYIRLHPLALALERGGEEAVGVMAVRKEPQVRARIERNVLRGKTGAGKLDKPGMRTGRKPCFTASQISALRASGLSLCLASFSVSNSPAGVFSVSRPATW